MDTKEKNAFIDEVFQDTNILSKYEAADLLVNLEGHVTLTTDLARLASARWVEIRNEVLKDYPSGISKAQIKKIAGIRNPRGAGRKSTQPPKQILVISATDDEIKFIRDNTTTRERAQIILAELM